MNGPPGRAEVGYRHRRSWIEKRPQVSANFGVREPDIRGGDSPYGSLSASVTFSAASGGEMNDPEVVLNFRFGHKVNVRLFSFTPSLHGVDPSDRAAESMAALERTLALERNMNGSGDTGPSPGPGRFTRPGERETAPRRSADSGGIFGSSRNHFSVPIGEDGRSRHQRSGCPRP